MLTTHGIAVGMQFQALKDLFTIREQFIVSRLLSMCGGKEGKLRFCNLYPQMSGKHFKLKKRGSKIAWYCEEGKEN